MAFGRNKEQGIWHQQKGWTKIWFECTVSSGTPTLVRGNGVTSVAKSATGKWTVTLTDEFGRFMGGQVSFLGTTEVGRNVQFESATFNTGVVIIRFYDQNSPGNLADVPDTTVYGELELNIHSGW
jgi:hypothetical protein